MARKIEELLPNMKYGNITIIVQDGKIIQIDKTEKHRIQIKENTVLLRKNPLQQN